MRRFGFALLLLFALAAVAQNVPVPYISQPLSPTTVLPGSRGFTLTVHGANFFPSAVLEFVRWQLVAAFVVWSIFAGGQTLNSTPPNPLPSAPYQPITGRQRFTWFVGSTIGPETLAAGLFSAGISTARDNPEEYGPIWEGFAKRYGMRLTGISTGNAMEAGLGTFWGEDPRYFRDADASFRDRLRRVVVMTFVAHNRKGNRMPAYARYISTPGNNFLSNTWRADSDATNRAAAVRTLWGFAGLMGKNAFAEFWPGVQQRIFHKKQ